MKKKFLKILSQIFQVKKDSMFKLKSTTFSEDGKRISYDYFLDRSIAKFFNEKEPFYLLYDKDVSTVPQSIAVIPLLANVMPIAWFVGFDIYVDELDATFYASLESLKAEFSIHFPEIKQSATLHVEKLINNSFTDTNSALLFSGGLDAFESLTRNIDKDPYLISVYGADIEIKDTKKWDDFKRFNLEEKIINKDRLCYVESNLQTFYTYEVDLLVNIGWWGKIQHGMALLTIIAPLSYIYGITTTLIASSNTGEISFGWGSTSETDEKVKWANQKVIHDGFHLRRTDKIENIINFAKSTGNKVKLRVCYSELRNGYNCNRCPKCQRTMFGFIISGENPEGYGFKIPADFYDLILKNFDNKAVMSVGVKYEWKCLQEKANTSVKPFIIKNETAERAKFNTFVKLNLDAIINKNQNKLQNQNKIKFIIISKFPRLFQMYLKIRRKF